LKRAREAPPVTPADVEAARERLGGRIQRTPLLALGGAPERPGVLWLKCENLQVTGAFKARGALHHLLRLRERDPRALARSVATYSSGNHGAALSWAARELGATATVFVPEDIPASKRAAIEGFGGRVVTAGLTSNARRRACEAAQSREGFAIVPPFDDPWIVAGQGTCGLEILEQAPEVSRVLVPVGGGGLLAGVALAGKSAPPQAEVIGVEPEAAASMKAALAAGRPVEIAVGETIADGLKPVQVGTLTHALAARLVTRVATVSDASIRRAMALLLEQAKLVVEPSGAAPVAAWLEDPAVTAGGVTVAVLSGGNVDAGRLASLISAPSPAPRA
jgi:threonine dehydratase